MKYHYIYKTSDGIRREDAIETESRELAFAELRKRGIRPIKVYAADGSKANGEVRVVVRKRLIAGGLIVGIVFGISVAFWYKDINALPDSKPSNPMLAALVEQSKSIVDRHLAEVATLHLEELRDYDKIFRGHGMGIMRQKIALGYCDANAMRKEIRALFKGIYADPTTDAGMKEEAQKLYQDCMVKVDALESRLINDDKAFRLLDTHRDKWTISDGRVVFTDQSLAEDFAIHARDLEKDQAPIEMQ